MRIGLVVNPIAGMGGRVGLKGTDGAATLAEARARGATARAGAHALRALRVLARRCPDARLAAPPGALGADQVRAAGLGLVETPLSGVTGTAEDTRRAVAAMAGCALVVFAGGDGTARDVSGALAPGQAMLGIPSGVKMHSGVFAVSPEAAGRLLADLLDSRGSPVAWDDSAEIVDIDETALRAGRMSPQLYGHARVPRAGHGIQPAKGGPRTDPDAALVAAAGAVTREMEPGVLYIVGPGTSAGAVLRTLGEVPTLLGVDAVRDGAVVARDASGDELERLAGDGPVKIILGVTGRQGFLIGRGNQQITPALLRRAGLIVLAAQDKLAALATPCLWVDSGDPALDAELTGFLRVRTAPSRETMMRLSAG